MQPEPADHRLRPTSTVKGQCESIVPLHFQVFPASSPRRTALSFFHFRPFIRRPSRPRRRPPILFQLFSLRTITTPSADRQTHANSRRFFRPQHPPLRMDDKKARLPAGKRAFSSVQFWDYCRFAQNLSAVFTLKPCSDAQTASSTRERNLSFLSVCLT